MATLYESNEYLSQPRMHDLDAQYKQNFILPICTSCSTPSSSWLILRVSVKSNWLKTMQIARRASVERNMFSVIWFSSNSSGKFTMGVFYLQIFESHDSHFLNSKGKKDWISSHAPLSVGIVEFKLAQSKVNEIFALRRTDRGTVSQLADCFVSSHLLYCLYKECSKCDVTKQSASWDTSDWGRNFQFWK